MIAVVGGGLAGLTAAYRLKKMGFPVTVYEARKRLGGRVLTAFFDGFHEELGGKFFEDGGEALQIKSLLKELNLEMEVCKFGFYRSFIWKGQIGDFSALIRQGPIPDENALNCLRSKIGSFRSLSDLLDVFFKGHTELRRIVDLRMRNYEGSSSSELSSSYLDLFWEFYSDIYKIVSDGGKEEFELSGVKKGGNFLIEALAKAIDGNIYLDHLLQKIAWKDDQTVSLFFEGGKKVEASAVIIAIPCTTLKHVEIEKIAEDQWQAIQSLQYGTNAKILVPVQMPYRDHPWFSILEEGAAWLNNDNSVLTLYYGGNFGLMDSSSLKKRLEMEIPSLKLLFPGITFPMGTDLMLSKEELRGIYDRPVGISWEAEKYSKGSYTNWGIGKYEQFQVTSQEYEETVRRVFRPIGGRLFFAGEHTAISHPATLEGAVDSGERAARIVKRALPEN